MKKDENKQKSLTSVGINWLITIYLNPLLNPYKQRNLTVLDLA